MTTRGEIDAILHSARIDAFHHEMKTSMLKYIGVMSDIELLMENSDETEKRDLQKLLDTCMEEYSVLSEMYPDIDIFAKKLSESEGSNSHGFWHEMGNAVGGIESAINWVFTNPVATVVSDNVKSVANTMVAGGIMALAAVSEKVFGVTNLDTENTDDSDEKIPEYGRITLYSHVDKDSRDTEISAKLVHEVSISEDNCVEKENKIVGGNEVVAEKEVAETEEVAVEEVAAPSKAEINEISVEDHAIEETMDESIEEVTKQDNSEIISPESV